VDFYFAKEFNISVKGFSSLPKVADVLAKLKTGKKLTLSESAMQEGMAVVATFDKLAPTVRLAALEDHLRSIKGKLRTLRSTVQRVKFAVILGKTWFDEFTSREENVLEIDGYTVTFSVTEVKVGF
jgi:hypothetical protein